MSRAGYAEMKDSGVEWLGEVPAHWGVRRLVGCLKSIESGAREQNEEKLTDGIPNLGGEHVGAEGHLLLKNMRYVSKDYFDNLRKGVISENDILLVKDGATIGKVVFIRALPFAQCTVNEHVFIMRSSHDCLPEYLYQNIRGRGIQESIWQQVTGAAQPGLNASFIKNISLCLPPFSEQTAIATFLHRETTKIDLLIEKKKQQIALLKEKRIALISHAVTKGLDHNAEMKNSGVEWLGEVPAHWDVWNLKKISRIFYGDSLSSEDREDGTTPVYGSNGQVGLHTDSNTKAPCIIIGRKGSFGKINFCVHPVFAIDTTFFIDDRATHANLLWLFYLLSLLDLDYASKDSAVPGLNRDDAYAKIVPLPSFDEQIAIATFLDRETANIDALVEKIEKSINLLREHRSALISAAVTGKVDVR